MKNSIVLTGKSAELYFKTIYTEDISLNMKILRRSYRPDATQDHKDEDLERTKSVFLD
jgi:hypothetical protein